MRFHIVGQKCPAEGCGSYNTRRVTILRFPQVGDACGKSAKSSLVRESFSWICRCQVAWLS